MGLFFGSVLFNDGFLLFSFTNPTTSLVLYYVPSAGIQAQNQPSCCEMLTLPIMLPNKCIDMLLVRTLCSADGENGFMDVEWTLSCVSEAVVELESVLSSSSLFVLTFIHTVSSLLHYQPAALWDRSCFNWHFTARLINHDLLGQQVDFLRCTDWSRWGTTWKETLMADRKYSPTQDSLRTDVEHKDVLWILREFRWLNEEEEGRCLPAEPPAFEYVTSIMLPKPVVSVLLEIVGFRTRLWMFEVRLILRLRIICHSVHDNIKINTDSVWKTLMSNKVLSQL